MKASGIDFSYTSPGKLVLDLESFFQPKMTTKGLFLPFENIKFFDELALIFNLIPLVEIKKEGSSFKNKFKKFFGKYPEKTFTDNSYFTQLHSLDFSIWDKFLIENACPILTNRPKILSKISGLSSFSIIDASTVKEVIRKYELFYFNTVKMDKTISLQAIKNSKSIRDKYV